jgi:hypothetical protein
MFDALTGLEGLAFSCGEKCPPDSFCTDAHVPGTKMTAQFTLCQYDWVCEALYFWCLAVLACAEELQLLRWVRKWSRPN